MKNQVTSSEIVNSVLSSYFLFFMELTVKIDSKWLLSQLTG